VLVALLAIAVLDFTLPSTGKNQITVYDPETGAASSDYECNGTTPIHQLQRVELYWNPITGGGYRFHHSQDVVGREGERDTMQIDPGAGGHARVVSTNPIGASCWSNEVWVPGSQTTDVPIESPTPRDRVLRTRLFDVRGRLVERPRAFAILFARDYYIDRVVYGGRVLVLHGGKLVRLKSTMTGGEDR